MNVGVVLAAGAGTRLGEPKAELMVGGRRLIDHAISTLLSGGCGRVVAVVRAAAAGAEALPQPVRLVVNPKPEAGMSSSLRLALEAVTEDLAADTAVIVLVDQVGITPQDVAGVIAGFAATGQVTVARRGGHRSHPVLLPREWFGDASSIAKEDSGARDFLDRHVDVTFVDLADVVTDIDTTVDLERARAGVIADA